MLFDFRKRRAAAATSDAPEPWEAPSDEELATWIGSLTDSRTPEHTGHHPYGSAS